MRTDIKPKVAVVKKEDPKEFEEEFDRRTDEIQNITGKSVTYADGFFIGIIEYEERTRVIESVKDEFHSEGIHFFCRDCELREQPSDKRIKHVNCDHSEYGHTHLDHEACEHFYRLVQQGKIKPL